MQRAEECVFADDTFDLTARFVVALDGKADALRTDGDDARAVMPARRGTTPVSSGGT
jgi:hypothetical protein